MHLTTPRPWDPAVMPSAQQVADWLTVCTDAERVWYVERAQENADTANLCWQGDHVNQIEHLQQQVRDHSLAKAAASHVKATVQAKCVSRDAEPWMWWH